MKKLLYLILVFAMVLTFAVPVMAVVPNGFITGDVTKIDKKGYDNFAGKEITSNNSVTHFNGFDFVADNKTLNAWYIDVLDDLKGTLEVAYKSGSNYFTVVFEIDGAGKYWIGDSKGSNGINMVKIGAFIAHVHDYTAVITPPTCDEDGYTTYTCACGDSYIDDIIPAFGHYSPFPTVTIEPTCTQPGQTVWYCIICGEITNIENDQPPALGHNYILVVTPPTCTEDGCTTYTCSRCGDSYVEIIPATGHNYDVDKINSAYYTLPTYEADGFWTFPCLNPGCDSSLVEQDVGSKLIHTHVYATDAEVIFVNPYRGHDDLGYFWSGDLTIKLTLSDGTLYEHTWSDYISISAYEYGGHASGNWYFESIHFPGLNLCKMATVYFRVVFDTVDDVTEAVLQNVWFENSADYTCGF